MRNYIFAMLLVTSSLKGGVCPSDCGPCNDLSGLILGAEGLCWTAWQDGLDYAIGSSGDVHRMHYEWNVGVRGWMGLKSHGCEGRVVYTWIKNKAKGSSSDSPLSAILLDPENQVDEASGQNSLEYQTLDVLFGRNISFGCDRFWIHPYFGARGLKIYQKVSATYDDAEVNPRSTLIAGGINGGIDLLYHLVGNLDIFGGAGGSVLGGKITFEGDRSNRCIPGYQYTAGFTWHKTCYQYYDFCLNLGYEFSRWYHVPTFADAENIENGKLTLNGITLSILFAF